MPDSYSTVGACLIVVKVLLLYAKVVVVVVAVEPAMLGTGLWVLSSTWLAGCWLSLHKKIRKGFHLMVGFVPSACTCAAMPLSG